jgi:hypothetical protein
MNGNGNYSETGIGKICEITPCEFLFSAGSSHLEPMCARRWAVAQFLALLVVPWYVKSCYLGQETCIISKHQATTMTIAIILYQMQMPSYSKRYDMYLAMKEKWKEIMKNSVIFRQRVGMAAS